MKNYTGELKWIYELTEKENGYNITSTEFRITFL